MASSAGRKGRQFPDPRNGGRITTAGDTAYGILARTEGAGSDLHIINSRLIETRGTSSDAIAAAATAGAIQIDNTGRCSGAGHGIFAQSDSTTTIVNSGSISAASLFAIDVFSGAANIVNTGTITGYVTLDAADTFTNQSGGTFEARLTSDFGAGRRFVRERVGRHRACHRRHSFVNLETFQNQGLISMLNGQVGDVFRISDLVGGTGLAFVASRASKLAVDAALGPPARPPIISSSTAP